jgi:hypothetical protein
MPQSRPTPDEAFASLLDARARLSGSSPRVQAEWLLRSACVRGIDMVAETNADQPGDVSEAMSRIYADEEFVAPTLPQACEPDTLACELGLAEGLTTREIERIRRSFALANHPDRVSADQRDLATRRMTVANMLIDKALAERRRKGRR